MNPLELSGPEAVKQPQIMMLPLLYFTTGMMLSCYLVLCVLPEQFNFSLISPQDVFPVALWSVKVLFGKVQVRSNGFFLESSSFLHGFLPWTPCLSSVLHMFNSWTEIISSSKDSFRVLNQTGNLQSDTFTTQLLVSLGGWLGCHMFVNAHNCLFSDLFFLAGLLWW